MTRRQAISNLCTARCGYPLDPLWLRLGVNKHPWCSLGVIGENATDQAKIAAIRRAERNA